MTAALRGLFCPVPTPFSDSGAADPGRLAAQIEVYRSFDLAGIVLFGTSGEGPLLEDAEEPALLEAAKAAAPGAWSVIVQVGRESVRAARAAAERATARGADALLCLPPRYYPYEQAELAGYFRAIGEATDRPLLVYHIPQRTHVDLPADLLARLAGEGVVAGVKDSSGDLELQRVLRERAGDGFAILNGKAAVTAMALAAGADGAILAVADGAPETAAELLASVAAGAGERAAGLQASLDPLAEVFGSRFGVPGIKAALDLRGWPGGGPPRPPLRPLDPEGREAVGAALRSAGVDLS